MSELPVFKPGDVLRASALNAIIEAVSPGRIRGGAGVVVRNGSGVVQITGVGGARRMIGVASANIAARSGTTPGAGTVNIKWYDGTAIADSGDAVSVYNGSSTTMSSGNGIDSGQYVWVEEDIFGTLWVSPMECS